MTESNKMKLWVLLLSMVNL